MPSRPVGGTRTTCAPGGTTGTIWIGSPHPPAATPTTPKATHLHDILDVLSAPAGRTETAMKGVPGPTARARPEPDDTHYDNHRPPRASPEPPGLDRPVAEGPAIDRRRG